MRVTKKRVEKKPDEYYDNNGQSSGRQEGKEEIMTIMKLIKIQ